MHQKLASNASTGRKRGFFRPIGRSTPVTLRPQHSMRDSMRRGADIPARNYHLQIASLDVLPTEQTNGTRIPRRLIWIEDEEFAGWCCSHCEWGLTAPGEHGCCARLQPRRPRNIRKTAVHSRNEIRSVLRIVETLRERILEEYGATCYLTATLHVALATLLIRYSAGCLPQYLKLRSTQSRTGSLIGGTARQATLVTTLKLPERILV